MQQLGRRGHRDHHDGRWHGRPWRLRRRRPRRQPREDHPHDRPGPHVQRAGEPGRRALRLRPGAAQGLRGRRHAPQRRLARSRGQRAPAGDLEPRGQRVGQHREPAAGRPGAGPDRTGQQALHAHAARDRDAPADGRGARLPRKAPRLQGRHGAGQRPRGMGQVRPPGVGSVPAGQDQPELLDERVELHRRRVLRRDRQVGGAHERGPGEARRRAVRQRRRGSRGALRRHDADLPQQLVPGRRQGYRAHLRLGRRGRGEVVARLQPRRSRRRAGSGRGRPPTQGAAGGDLPDGGHAVLRQPADHPRRAVGEPRAAAGGRAVPRLRAAAREPAAGPGVRLPPRQPSGGRR